MEILLSTYNGQKYISDQLDSILSQNYKNIILLIRDDGSTDSTTQIIEKYMTQHQNIQLIRGKNVGVINSFFELIKSADLNHEYYALADQDDWWLPHKLTQAVMNIQPYSKEPALYCGSKIFVDENLKLLKTDIKSPVYKVSFGNALVQNICTGCTCVFNRKLLELVQQTIPQHAIMHDWWLYLTATCFGKVYYDSQAYIYYRQHHLNVSAAIYSKKQLLFYRIKQLFQNRGQIYRQAHEFNEKFNLPSENQKLLQEFLKSQVSWRYRVRVIRNPAIFRQKKEDNFVLKVIILLGKL